MEVGELPQRVRLALRAMQAPMDLPLKVTAVRRTHPKAKGELPKALLRGFAVDVGRGELGSTSDAPAHYAASPVWRPHRDSAAFRARFDAGVAPTRD